MGFSAIERIGIKNNGDRCDRKCGGKGRFRLSWNVVAGGARLGSIRYLEKS